MLPRKSSRGLEMVASKGSMLLSFIVNNPGKAPDELESSRHWKLVSVFMNSCGIREKYQIIPPIHGGAIQMTHEKIKGLELITLELEAWTEITAN